MASFTDQIRRAVDASGMSRYAIAKRLGIPESSMSRFMTGGGLSFENLDALAALLGLRVAARGKSGATRGTRQAGDKGNQNKGR